jgi:RHH-type transcriptional regulator, rel operon repressor / antitoxin RelB
MNKRVTLDMPEEMLRLIEKYAAEAGTKPDAYMLHILEERLEDQYLLARAEEIMERRERGESKTYSLEEVKQELGLEDCRLAI